MSVREQCVEDCHKFLLKSSTWKMISNYDIHKEGFFRNLEACSNVCILNPTYLNKYAKDFFINK